MGKYLEQISLPKIAAINVKKLNGFSVTIIFAKKG
jgi:hypothetical protein